MSEVIQAETDEGEVNDILQSAKVQYGGEKVFHMGRRMSGMPLLHRMDKSYAQLDEFQLRRFNELLDKFPPPPNALPGASVAANATSHNTRSSGGWGSIRGLAEKFNVFAKS